MQKIQRIQKIRKSRFSFESFASFESPLITLFYNFRFHVILPLLYGRRFRYQSPAAY